MGIDYFATRRDQWDYQNIKIKGFRYELANKVIDKCDELGLKKCISGRTLREFEDGWKKKNLSEDRIEEEKSLLEKFALLLRHFGN